MPKTRLYLSSERFGLDGTAAVIDAAIQAAGGHSHEETLTEKAARLQRAHSFREEQNAFVRSERGVNEGKAAFEKLISALQQKLKELGTVDARYGGLRVEHRAWEIWIMRGLRPFMTFGWEYHYANTLEGASLQYALYSGPITLPGTIPPLKEGQRMKSGKFTFELLPGGSTGYVDRSDKSRTQSPDQLAEFLISMYIEAADKLAHQRD
jgi:hypothetical protein